MTSFSHDCIFVIDQTLVDIFKSFIALSGNLTVRLRPYLILMLFREAHTDLISEHLKCGLLLIGLLLAQFHPSHVVNVRRASIIYYRFIRDLLLSTESVYYSKSY